MLKIRLSRTGKKSQPCFRVVLQEHTSAAKGKFIEAFGFYRPTSANKEFSVEMERIQYWLSVGAQPSDAVATLLKKAGVDEMDKYIGPRNKKRKSKKEVAEAPAATAAPAPAAAAAPAPAAAAAPAPAAPAPAEEPKPEETPKEEAPAEEPKAEEEPKKDE